MRIPKSMAQTMPVTRTPGVLTGIWGPGSGRLGGAGRLLTAQHSHELLQQVQELLDVHQVLGLQALPGRGEARARQWKRSQLPSWSELRPSRLPPSQLAHGLPPALPEDRLAGAQGLHGLVGCKPDESGGEGHASSPL